jgi:ubiquinone/menaquinone biosynthesis C-methylase UbiE
MAPHDDTVSPAQFYDCLAKGYDAMTDFASRTARAGLVVESLLERYGVHGRRAADVGCGTGAYTLALAKAGLETVGVDPSSEMIQQAEANAERMGMGSVRFRQGTLADLPAVAPSPRDVVLCMGNTLPHILTNEELATSLAAARSVLPAGGILVLQLLNYERILAEQERIVSIDTHGGESFVRFYDFLPDGLVRFNLLRFTPSDGQHSLSGVLLRPYTQEQLANALEQAGFASVDTYGSLDLSPFDPQASETVMLVARA